MTKKTCCIWLLIITVLSISCEKKRTLVTSVPVDWGARVANFNQVDSLESGTTYLSTYSLIYIRSENRYWPLTNTISMKNTNLKDSIFVDNIEYYNTHGRLIKSYIDKPIYIRPMETIEIVLEQKDRAGGTGANFLFNWKIKPGTTEPLFEGVMVYSDNKTTAFSFLTEGKRIE